MSAPSPSTVSSPPPPALPPSNPIPPTPAPVSPANPPTPTPVSPAKPPTPSPEPPTQPPVKPPTPAPEPPPPAPVSPSEPPPPVPVIPPPPSPPPASPPPGSPPPENSPPPPESTPPPPSSPAPPPSDRSPPPPPPSAPTPNTPLLSPPPPSLSPPPPYEPPPAAPSPSPSSSSSTALIAGISAGAVIGVLLLVGLVFFLCFKKRSRRNPYDPFHPSPPPSADPYRQFQQSPFTPPSVSTLSDTKSGSQPIINPKPMSPAPAPAMAGGAFKYEDLEIATNGFAESNVLGQGGFGLVYQGTLTGKEVAIKKLTSGSGQGDREFRAEVEIISRVHHKNLVSLVGYCVHEDQRLLVYEYVPNKTLDFHLHGSGRPTLDWPRRWKIALGSAKGLAYLHEDCDPKIIHRDIKAANILLDYNFEPKVADFGLAKFVPTNVTHVSTRIMGTFGYVAPEYVTSGKLTDRSDVYSYGVMLLELITGRKPIMPSDPDMDQSLVNWAKALLTRTTKEDIFDELVDPWLETNYDHYDMKRLIHCANAAVRDSAKKRPRMGQIVRYLEGEISLEDLNAGMMPGDSKVKTNTSEQDVLRRMAFGGVLSEDLAESDMTSDYDLQSSTGANTEEMEQQRLNKMEQSSSEV
ncbi:proline-rich receptor-like protein kinase PERK3 isoform X1 [Carex rostrata]